ncbi:ribonuclease P [Candidatus Woesearchaeota archaeon]|nr:ribonuclease P [Candidatus Woesearchaeota archaeon]
MKQKRSGKKSAEKVVLKLIQELFSKASSESDQRLADRYVRKARRLAQKARMPIPYEFKKRFCRHCGTYWTHGKTVRVRLQKQKVVYYCLSCRHYTRHPYVREKKARRQSKAECF